MNRLNRVIPALIRVIPALIRVIPALIRVIPAQAGILPPRHYCTIPGRRNAAYAGMTATVTCEELD